MKKNWFIAIVITLVTAWSVGFFLLKATAVIHTLAWLAVLLLLDCLLKGYLRTPVESEKTQV